MARFEDSIVGKCTGRRSGASISSTIVVITRSPNRYGNCPALTAAASASAALSRHRIEREHLTAALGAL
jgi:hypothetical protein